MGKCIKIPNGFITLANTEFNCPFCNAKHDDNNDEYLKRCNKNKSGYTVINCDCEKKFGMTYNIMGDAVSFKLNK